MIENTTTPIWLAIVLLIGAVSLGLYISLTYLVKRKDVYTDTKDISERKIQYWLIGIVSPFVMLSTLPFYLFDLFENSLSVYMYIIIMALLTTVIATDILGGYILDICLLPLAILGAIHVINTSFIEKVPFIESPLLTIIFLIVAFIIMFLVVPGGMGFGDVKLLLIMAALTTPVFIFTTMTLMCLLGFLHGAIARVKKGQPFILGPSIVYAYLITLVFSIDDLVSTYVFLL